MLQVFYSVRIYRRKMMILKILTVLPLYLLIINDCEGSNLGKRIQRQVLERINCNSTDLTEFIMKSPRDNLRGSIREINMTVTNLTWYVIEDQESEEYGSHYAYFKFPISTSVVEMNGTFRGQEEGTKVLEGSFFSYLNTNLTIDISALYDYKTDEVDFMANGRSGKVSFSHATKWKEVWKNKLLDMMRVYQGTFEVFVDENVPLEIEKRVKRIIENYY